MLPVESGHFHIPTTNVSYFHFLFLQKLHTGSYFILILYIPRSIILSNNHVQPTSKQKLMTMFELTENDIKQIYKLPFKTTNKL
jgi:hypothetical protein